MKKKQNAVKPEKKHGSSPCRLFLKELMEHPVYPVFLLFVLGTAVRFYLSWFQSHIFLFTDEIILLEASKCIASGCQIAVRNIPYHFMHILYPLAIAPANLIPDAQLSFSCLKLINSVIMNSAVFPAYFLARRIIPERAFLMAAFSLMLPDLAFVSSVFAEVLLYPVCMWFFFCLWMYLEEGRSGKWLACLAIAGIAAFFVKAVAAALLLGAAIFVVVCMFFDGGAGSRKRAVAVSAIGVGALVILLVLLNRTSAAYLVNFSYLLDTGRIWAMLRYFLYFMAFASLACGIYFIAFPAASFKNMPKRLQEFFVAVCLCFVSAIGAVIFIVSMYEDYPASAMTPHIRYLFHFIMPFCMIFFAVPESGLSKAAKIASIVFCVFMQWGIVRFPEGNYTAFMDIAYLRESLSAPFISVNPIFFKMKASVFDLLKIFVLAFMVFMSFLIFKDRIRDFKICVCSFFVVACLINNVLCFKSGCDTISKDADILRAQVLQINSLIGNSKALVISGFAASEKVFETYSKQKYWFTSEEMYRSACGNYYFGDAKIPLISVQWAAEQDPEKAKSSKWRLLDTASSVADPIMLNISPDYVIVGASAPDMMIKTSPDVIVQCLVPGALNYRVYKVVDNGRRTKK